jgi:alkylation response protein AidB-like acyl-CoA dehydrogenase
MTALTSSTQGSPAGELEHLLESLAHEGGPFSPARMAELDQRDAFPAEAVAALDGFGLSRYYVPTRHGGLLSSFEELVQLWRAVARRDLTVAVGHGKTLLGAGTVWIAGEPEQAARLGAEIAGGTVVSWGLTERHHGSDLLAGELKAERCEGGWRVNGEKWLINNATRGHMICVLARTDPAGGPRGFSLLLVDKRRLPAGTYRSLPKELTHGIRGADISGISFQAAEVPAEALVGRPGEGIELVLKTLQFTRVMCVGLSLGAADHALKLAVDFAKQRNLYDRHLIELPRVRRVLGEAATTLFLAEAVSVVACRSLHALTPEMSVVSSMTKAFVPTMVDELIGQLGELLGARAFLSDVYAEGQFQKLERDHRIVAIFDGSTVVNRNALINQFPTLTRAYRNRRRDEAGLAEAMTLSAPLTDFEPKRLSLLSSMGCSVVQSLSEAVERVRDLASRGEVAEKVAQLAEQLRLATEATLQEMASYTPSPRDVPPTAFTLAVRYELCFAGAACLQLWLHNAQGMSGHPLWKDALWLEACLVRVLGRLRAGTGAEGTEVYDLLADALASGQWQTAFSPLTRGGAGGGS